MAAVLVLLRTRCGTERRLNGVSQMSNPAFANLVNYGLLLTYLQTQFTELR